MKWKQIIGTVFSVLLLLLQACDKDDFSIERTDVEIRVGETLALAMRHASGNCRAEVMNPTIVEAAVKDGKLELFATDEGTTTVRLTDDNNEPIEIHVASKLQLQGMWRIENASAYQYSAYAQDSNVASDIWEQLKKKPPYLTDRLYAFVPEGEVSEGLGGNVKPIYYRFADGKLRAEGEDGEKHAFTIVQWTEKGITLQEDLNGYFSVLYPHAGIINAKQKITWTRYRNK